MTHYERNLNGDPERTTSSPIITTGFGIAYLSKDTCDCGFRKYISLEYPTELLKVHEDDHHYEEGRVGQRIQLYGLIPCGHMGGVVYDWMGVASWVVWALEGNEMIKIIIGVEIITPD